MCVAKVFLNRATSAIVSNMIAIPKVLRRSLLAKKLLLTANEDKL